MPLTHISPADGTDGHGLMVHLIRIPSGMTGTVWNLGPVNSVPTIIIMLNSGVGHLVALHIISHVKKVNMHYTF